MEQHAVPQNITTFEFKLFGPFTIRQFIYVAAGGIVGAIFYFSPLPKTISYVIGAIFVLGGIGFAAIPLQGRSLDKWIVAFFRSITRPTQRIWIKDNQVPYFLETSFLKPAPLAQPANPASSQARLSRADLQTLLAKQTKPADNNPFDLKENQFLASISHLASQVTPTSAPPPQNQAGNLSPFSPYQRPLPPVHTTVQAAPKQAQLQAKQEEIKAQEIALAKKQKDLEEVKLKLEEEKIRKVELLGKTSPQSTTEAIVKRPEPEQPTLSTPELKIEKSYPTSAQTAPPKPLSTPIDSSPVTEKSAQKLAELDQVLQSQKKIEAEIKAKEAEIVRQQQRIHQEQEKFSLAWEEFERNKNIAEQLNTSTPDILSGHTLPNVGKKTVVSPLPSSNFSALNSHPSVAAQIASDINFGGNVIAIPGSQIQFLQGVGDTRIRKLRTRPPDFSKPTLPILGERQFDISKELAKRFDQPTKAQTLSAGGGIAIEPAKEVRDFEPVKAGTIKERDAKIFAPPPSPNLPNKPKTASSLAPQPAVNHPQTPQVNTKAYKPVQPFNYQKNMAKQAPKAQVKINLSDHPNTPNGVVYNSQGGLVEGALISVYDSAGKPVRAFKTNGLGQFVSVTPLANGHYTIQTDFDGLNFDTIAFEAKGKLLEPFAITAKN